MTSRIPLFSSQIATEAEIEQMVRGFYARIRADVRLGPIFAAHVRDWTAHEARLAQFWSSVLLGSGNYSGSPMARHVALPDLTAELFQHWLSLFREHVATLPNLALASQALVTAERIADSLWRGYRSVHPTA